MDRKEAEKITKGFEEAYVRAHTSQNIEVLREGFHPDVEIFLNGRLQAQGLDAYLTLYEPMLSSMRDFVLTKTCRGVNGDRITVTYECSFTTPEGDSKLGYGIEVWDMENGQ
ncbi:MAG: nuclear transport factor 2 family protein, partial [Actinomycetota bacterium]|nr:nuclear transport factor 2 family protein [Actinomycetota bacterium]